MDFQHERTVILKKILSSKDVSKDDVVFFKLYLKSYYQELHQYLQMFFNENDIQQVLKSAALVTENTSFNCNQLMLIFTGTAHI